MSTQSAQIIVQTRGEIVKVISLSMQQVVRVGRTPDNTLQLESGTISRNHAEIRVGPQGVTLTDLGSANGTFIGEQRLLPNQPHLLTDGTAIRIGPYLLIYRAANAEQAEPAAADEPVSPIPEMDTLPPEVAIVAHKRGITPQAIAPVQPLLTDAPQSLYARFLPDIYQENDFLQRFLRIFEDIWEPLEHRMDHISLYFDPRTCPVSFLPWLASWLDIPLNQHWPEARQRHLLSQAMELYSWRGTSYGLASLIEICTGLTPEITEKPQEPFVFHIRITLSAASQQEGVDRSFIEELIQTHKPAHAGYILEII